MAAKRRRRDVPSLSPEVERAVEAIITRGRELAALETPAARREANRGRERFRLLKEGAQTGARGLVASLEALAPHYPAGHFAGALAALASLPDALDWVHAGKGTTRSEAGRYVVAAVYGLALDAGISVPAAVPILERVNLGVFGKSDDEETLLNRLRLSRRRMEAQLVVYMKRRGHAVRQIREGERMEGEGAFLVLPNDPRKRARVERERGKREALVARLESTGSLHANVQARKPARRA